MNLRVALLLTTLVATGVWVRTLPPSTSMAREVAAWWPLNGSIVVTLYFTDGRVLFPVSRRIGATDVPRAALQALLDGPNANSELTSPIPLGVETRSFDVSGGVAHIDLSAAALGSGEGTRAVERAIVETMTALPGISAVTLSVEGKPLAERAVRTPLLYYASARGLTAIPASTHTPDTAVAAFMTGPGDRTLTGLPRDVRLLHYKYDAADGLVSLDFSYTESVRTLALETPHIMRSVLLGLIASLTELPGVRAVRIDFDGHTRLGLGECSDLLGTRQPRPRLLNDERLLGR